ncbi:chemotaxis protein CheD (plasmid) [Pontibacillus sp. ALD_SL1]|uniref:chemotaxis protein CheD n=1 Tax=Pontibacillus sp. ALD_SL1 TaxID=2777185 RepID=UPI001A969B48|nr:chemotaxis protein CheD [Pontibacillus sp. ALD_SL1]QST02068.1 chemotaxis protein CheD [Pontibacillus sp. ALD_SL1]
MDIVRMGEYKLTTQNHILRTNALGSCVALILWNPQKKKGAMSHIMLPFPTSNQPPSLLGKYASTVIPQLVYCLGKEGTQAMLFGGAAMYTPENQPRLNIGKRNTDFTIDLLRQINIPILYSHIGGTVSRSVEFDSSKQKVTLFLPENKIVIRHF